MSDTTLRRTPLFEMHRRAGAKMIDFGGWEMPVQYSGIVAEHRQVRESAGMFDVSHMGRVFVSGRDAGEFLQLLVTNDAGSLAPLHAIYTLICNRAGGVRDDVIVSRLGETQYMVVPNASNREKVLEWIGELLTGFHEGSADVEVTDRTTETVMVALQGPRAQEVLQSLVEVDLSKVSFFGLARTRVGGAEAIVSRTGYTGEDGFEVILPNEAGVELWSRLLESEPTNSIRPAGLGARDTLRIEAGFPLYGHELAEDINPIEAGLARFVRRDGADFVGGEALERIAHDGPARRLAGLEVTDGAIARPGTVVQAGGKDVGYVSSGTFSPTLGRSIAMAFVAPEVADSRPPLGVVVRGNTHPSQVVDLPFFRRRKRK
ncbi:MAG TPA: glycine cleavage system aminomethyltransferase GcvT [Chloroflexota bacterium]